MHSPTCHDGARQPLGLAREHASIDALHTVLTACEECNFSLKPQLRRHIQFSRALYCYSRPMALVGMVVLADLLVAPVSGAGIAGSCELVLTALGRSAAAATAAAAAAAAATTAAIANADVDADNVVAAGLECLTVYGDGGELTRPGPGASHPPVEWPHRSRDAGEHALAD